MRIFIYLPIGIPFILSIITLVLGEKIKRKLINILTLLSILSASIVCLLCFVSPGNYYSSLFYYNKLSGYFLLTAVIGLITTLIYQYNTKENNRQNYFINLYMQLGTGLLCGVFSARNNYVVYIIFAMTTVLSYLIIISGGINKTNEDNTVKPASYKFIYCFCTSIILLFIGILILYLQSQSGDTEINKDIFGAGYFFVILGFSAAVCIFPLHSWNAETGYRKNIIEYTLINTILSKAGFYCIIRFFYYNSFPFQIKQTWAYSAWIVLAVISVIINSSMAYRVKSQKKKFAYLTAAQLSYIMIGLAIGNDQTFTGALSHLLFSTVIFSGLFICSGIFFENKSDSELYNKNGVIKIKSNPAVLCCYILLSLSAAGMPLFCGFQSLWQIAYGAFESGFGILNWITPVSLLYSSLVVIICLLSPLANNFLKEDKKEESETSQNNMLSKSVKPVMFLLIILTLSSLVLGINGGVFITFIKNII